MSAIPAIVRCICGASHILLIGEAVLCPCGATLRLDPCNIGGCNAKPMAVVPDDYKLPSKYNKPKYLGVAK